MRVDNEVGKLAYLLIKEAGICVVCHSRWARRIRVKGVIREYVLCAKCAKQQADYNYGRQQIRGHQTESASKHDKRV